METLQTDYDRMVNTISQLVLGSHGWLETLLFVAFGAVLVGLANRLRGVSVFLLPAGVALFMVAAFPTVAPGENETMVSIIHEYAAMAAVALLPAACFKLYLCLKSDAASREMRMICLAAGICGLILGLAGLLALSTESNYIGAIERMILLNGLIWLQAVGIYIWHSNPRKSGNHTRYMPKIARDTQRAITVPVQSRYWQTERLHE